MRNRLNTYLAIAVTTYCNYQCFYCKEGGESISKEKETISFKNIKKIIGNAYEVGIRNFRITGGEPTGVCYFSKLIKYIMEFKDTKVRINTNGYKILKHIHVLEEYKNRLDIVFSVDSLSEKINGVCFPKYLSKDVINVTKILKEKGISVRYNIVVTSLNKNEVEKLVLKAIDELHVNVKLLDLNKFQEYLGYTGKVQGEEAIALWNRLFVPMKKFYTFLEEISNDSEPEWTTGFIGKGNGIPMSFYMRGENWIQVKDSTRGAKYCKFCVNSCKWYKQNSCKDGVFSLFLSSNLTLHLSGCKNESIQFKLNECDDEQMKKIFNELLDIMEN